MDNGLGRARISTIFQACHLLNCDRCQLVLLPILIGLNGWGWPVKFGQREFDLLSQYCTKDPYSREGKYSSMRFSFQGICARSFEICR